MKYLFFTDPHLGVKRNAHTTSKSQELLRSFLFESVRKFLHERTGHPPIARLPILNPDKSAPKAICCGDLVDTYTNKEDVISEAAIVSLYCDYTLAGNHDSRNNVETKSTLQLIAELNEHTSSKFVISPNGSEPYFWEAPLGEEEDKVTMWFIPHCFTQQVFEDSIQQVIEASQQGEKRYNILALHCNVDEVHGASEVDSSTLVLTRELQQKCKVFDLVLVGHEHTARKKGNIQILGNWFPVSFGEIDDRYVYFFDTETKELTREMIFKKEDIFAEIDANDMLESEGEIELPHRMIDVTGDVEAVDYPRLMRALAKFWKINENTLFAVRNSASIGAKRDVKNTKRLSAMTLIDRVKDAAGKSGYAVELKLLVEEMDKENQQ